MKRFGIFLGLVLSILISTKIVAKDESCLAQNNYQRANYLQSYYDDFYEQALKVDIKEITKTEDVYPYILKHKELIEIRNSKVIFDYEKSNLNDIEISLVKQTIDALQYMMDTNEIVFDENLRIIDVGYWDPKESSSHENSNREHVYATSFDLLRECDDHVQEFKQYVYFTSKFSTSFINHWIWFARKVKPNGEWDYKVNLGWNTYYSCYNLGRMSGETIGNFHYGYVGSYYFSPSTLKYLSGIVNVITNGLDRDIEYYYLDDPKDIRDIEWGIDVYRRRN